MTSKTGSSRHRVSIPIRRRNQTPADKLATVVTAGPKAPPPATANGSTRKEKPVRNCRDDGWHHGDHDPNAERPWVLSP